MGVVPSFALKTKRAKYHLDDVKRLIADFGTSNPYTVGIGGEDDQGRNIRTLVFQHQPSDDIAIVIGDFIHNVRSACDHLAAAMSKPKFRDQSQFPIFDVDPFERDPSTGEYLKGRERSRQAWERFTQGMTGDGRAALKKLQPFNTAGNNATYHALTMLRELSNTDKHRKLALVASGIRNPTVSHILPSGITTQLPTEGDFSDGAQIAIAPKDVDVKITGTPLVMASISSDGGFVELPGALDTIFNAFNQDVFSALLPFLVPE